MINIKTLDWKYDSSRVLNETFDVTFNVTLFCIIDKNKREKKTWH